MATAFTHGFIAAALGKAAFAGPMPARFWVLTIACSLMPDLDIIGFRAGIRYADVLGHRGFTHSLLFALLTGLFVTAAAFRDIPRYSRRWWALAAYFSFVTASHGILDALTGGGYGIAFLSPVDTTRYFLPWQPLPVSAIGIRGFFSPRGLQILLQEALRLWLPSTLLVIVITAFRRRSSASHRAPGP